MERNGHKNNYQSFSIDLINDCKIERNELMQKLLDKGISTRRRLMTSHQETTYIKRKEILPISENLPNNSIIIPIYPGLSQNQLEYCINSIKTFLVK